MENSTKSSGAQRKTLNFIPIGARVKCSENVGLCEVAEFNYQASTDGKGGHYTLKLPDGRKKVFQADEIETE